MMSGSSVANTITVGSFTIPLMKKMGMTPEKAAAIDAYKTPDSNVRVSVC
nr:TRAP transporter large permease subunit [Anaplasma phagocytophilum]